MCYACVARGNTTSWAAFDHANGEATLTTASDPATSGGTVSATGNQNIDAVLVGYRWSGAITYSFPDARGDYEASYAEADNGFGPISSEQMQAARYILEGTSSAPGGPRMAMTALEQFTSTSISDAGRNGADIRIAQSGAANPTAYAYYPVGDYRAGDVWFGTQTNYTRPQVGDFAYHTMIHELGHALGLKHGHAKGGPANVAMTPDRDSMEFSVMTYRSYVSASLDGYTNETFGYAQTFMMYDIAALQHMYGANFSTNAGDTIYRWDPSTGETFINGVGQGRPGGNRVFLTVWDGDGNDTYDFSNYATNLWVDLTPGAWSLISQAQQANLGNGNYARGNVFNALQYQGSPRSLIENAFGGLGDDVLIGNQANNVLRGNGGYDRLFGREGIDEAQFDFGLQQAAVSLGSSALVVDSASGRTELNRVEVFRFTDGLVNNNDGYEMLNDLFYYGVNRDVYASGIDAEVHYNATGWREGRNPNKYFDTLGYLMRYADVAAAGVNPLHHYLNYGWHEGRDPSASFDTIRYLAAYTDVAAAGINPLLHFTAFGLYEGRSTFGDSVFA